MSGFEIDSKAFRASNVGRPPEHLIREAVQNAFDENPNHVRVMIEPAKGRGVKVAVCDDGPGFADEREIWTIFASGKRDDAQKRGRLGRGLKELISVASSASVTTRGKRYSFEWKNGRINRKRAVSVGETTGTLVEATVPSWKKPDILSVAEYLARFIPPDGTQMSVNGVVNERPTPKHDIHCRMLRTVEYDDGGVPKERYRDTTVRLLDRRDKQGNCIIYEMGIPVESIPEEDGFEWSIDVQQRTPLRPERDMLPRYYIHDIYAQVANALMDQLPDAELTDLWMENAVSHHSFEKGTVGKTYTERRFGANAARAIVNDTHDRNGKALQDGHQVLNAGHLSPGVRELVRNHLPTTADLYPATTCPTRFIPRDDWCPGMESFASFARWLAIQLRIEEPQITFFDAPEACCEAQTNARTANKVEVNRAVLGAAFFSDPRLANWLPLIVHEFSHRSGMGHDATFWREVERLSGEAAEIVHRSHETASELLYTESSLSV